MPELPTILERASHVVDLEPNHFDRLVRRRDRRRRNRRIGAGIFASTIALGAIGYAYDAFHGATDRVPTDMITVRNVGQLGLAWRFEEVRPGALGTGTVRDRIVYVDDGNGVLHGLPLSCTPTDGWCQPVWSAGPAPNYGHNGFAVGERFVYAGSTGLIGPTTQPAFIIAYSRSCQAERCPARWRSAAVPNGGPADPVGEIGDRVYVIRGGGDTLDAFARACGRDVCEPVWIGHDTSPPALIEGRAVVRTSDGVAAFDANCWEARGEACRAIWAGHTSPPDEAPATLPPPLVVGDRVLVTDRVGITVFPLDCHGVCRSEWAATIPGGPGFQPVVENGMVFDAADGGTELYAFPLDCPNGGRSCEPSWIGHTEERIGFAPVADDGYVLVATEFGDSLSVFPMSCPRDCSPAWVAHLDDSIAFPPVVNEGLVYVSGLEGLTVFPTPCQDGCESVFHWELPSGGSQSAPLVVGDSVVLTGGNTAFTLRLGFGRRPAESSETRSPLLPAVLLLASIVLVAVVRRRRRRFQ